MVWPAVIAAGAALGGGLLSSRSSAKQASKQMDFQERMSNTAYQRAADDLEAAGLNRILALGSPASTPGGAMGQVPNFGSAMSEGANAGTNIAASAQQIAKQKQEVNKIIQETKNLTENERLVAAKADVVEAIAPILAEAGNNYNNLLNMMTDGGFVAYMGNTLADAAKEELNVLTKILAEKYDQAESTIDDLLGKAKNMWEAMKADHNTKRERVINLGSGGPQ